MSKITNGKQTVQPPSQSRPSKLLCILVFAAVGGAVYSRGLFSPGHAGLTRSCTATARITIRPPSAAYDPEAVVEFSPLPLPDVEELRQRIASEASVGRALAQLATAADGMRLNGQHEAGVARSVETVRPKVQVSARETSAPGGLEIAVSCTDADPGYAAGVANALAEDFARHCRCEWRERTYPAYVEARDASKCLQQQWCRAKAELEAFLEQQICQPVPDPGPSPPAAESPPEGPGTAGETDSGSARGVASDSRTTSELDPLHLPNRQEPVLVDNPDWVEMHEALAALQRHRDQLLIDRTPAHPEVEQAAAQISELKRRLAALPEKIPAALPEVPPPPQPPVAQTPPVPRTPPAAAWPGRLARDGQATPDQTEQRRAELTERLRELAAAVDRAGESHYEAVCTEKRAWQKMAGVPRIEVELATPSGISTAVQSPRTGLLLMALVAGLAAAGGLGMVSAGTGMEPALATLEQAERILPSPIVGTIPETDPASKPRAATRWRSLLRLTLILGGLAAIVGCFSVLLHAASRF